MQKNQIPALSFMAGDLGQVNSRVNMQFGNRRDLAKVFED